MSLHTVMKLDHCKSRTCVHKPGDTRESRSKPNPIKLQNNLFLKLIHDESNGRNRDGAQLVKASLFWMRS